VAFLREEAEEHAKRHLIEISSSFVELTGLYPYKVAAFFVLLGQALFFNFWKLLGPNDICMV